jgi:hypothetical protein
MVKLPSWQFYPGDWRKDPGVQSLSYHDRGVWHELLLLMFESSDRGKLLLNGRPFPEDSLARLLGLDKQSLTTTITTLLASGVASRDPQTGALFNRRMVRDEEIRRIRAEAGIKGGNPVLLIQNRTSQDKQEITTRVNQNPTPSSSFSSSSSKNKHLLFERFWKAYPKKKSRGQAEKAWAKVDPNETLLEKMIAIIEAMKKTEQWRREKGQFIPYPATWLNAKGWEDDVECVTKPSW